jgi:hypothetical protein
VDNKIYGISGLVVGFLVAFLIFGKAPDVKVVTQIKVLTKTVTINKDRIIDRETIKYLDGTVKIIEHEVIKDKIVEKEVVKEVLKEKMINYTGSAFVMFDNLTLVPSDVGISYLIIPPIQAIAQYDINNKKIKIGLMLQF